MNEEIGQVREQDMGHSTMSERPVYEQERIPPYPQAQELRQAIEKKPSRQAMLRDYSIVIRFLSIGCVVEVGCKSIPFTSVDEAMTELAEYTKDPAKSIEKWNKIFNQD